VPRFSPTASRVKCYVLRAPSCRFAANGSEIRGQIVSDGSSACNPLIVKRAAEWIRRLQNAAIDSTQLGDHHPLTQEIAKRGAQILGPLGEPVKLGYIDHSTNHAGRMIPTSRVSVLPRSATGLKN
jgi:hypothetical protein